MSPTSAPPTLRGRRCLEKDTQQGGPGRFHVSVHSMKPLLVCHYLWLCSECEPPVAKKPKTASVVVEQSGSSGNKVLIDQVTDAEANFDEVHVSMHVSAHVTHMVSCSQRSGPLRGSVKNCFRISSIQPGR